MANGQIFDFSIDLRRRPYNTVAPCGDRGCKNSHAPFPGWMSYKATKPGLVSVLYYLSMFFNCVGVYYGPFLCIVSFHCMFSVFWLF